MHMAKKNADKLKELVAIVKVHETIIRKLKAENLRLNEMIKDFKGLVGEDNFQEILELRGYQSKK
jgi:hypothetical protein